jgi:hypothetical protein
MMKQVLVPSLTFCLLSFGLLLGHARAQDPSKTLPRAEDVKSVDAIIAAVYDVISGPSGQKRDWERMRSLFAPGARLMPTAAVRPPGSPPDYKPTGDEPLATTVLDVDGYVARAGKYLEENGFFERESARRVETYGHIAHVWSTYEARHKADDPKPFMRGINSIQLMNDGKRWWVVSIFWEAETPHTPLPEKYLKSVR